jgi:galactonate dehydratase
MKITNIRTHIVMPINKLAWVFVEVDTDQGISGLGECTEYIGNPHLVRGLEAVKPLVIGTDPRHIEEIWQRLFHAYSNLNSRGYISHLISAIDIALWDIRGKVLGVPIYELLGGPVRKEVSLYTHVRDQWHSPDVDTMMTEAREAKEMGYLAIKTDPIPPQLSSLNSPFKGATQVEYLDAKAIVEAVKWMEALRETVGPHFELLVDAHGRFDVASAIKACHALAHIDLVWFEEPTHVESDNALRQVRENTNVPLCVGERHFTRWDYWQLLNDRLVDYVMPDVAWCGGISEWRRIAAMAEVQYIRVSPHDALGPIALAASFQLSMATPNLYREECLHTWFPHMEGLITPMLDIRAGSIYPSGQPGLGIELDMDGINEYRVDIDDLQASLPY